MVIPCISPALKRQVIERVEPESIILKGLTQAALFLPSSWCYWARGGHSALVDPVLCSRGVARVRLMAAAAAASSPSVCLVQRTSGSGSSTVLRRSPSPPCASGSE